MYEKDTQMREIEYIQKFNVRRTLVMHDVHVVPGFFAFCQGDGKQPPGKQNLTGHNYLSIVEQFGILKSSVCWIEDE